MDLKALQQEILSSDKSDAEKAQMFIDNKTVRQLTVSQWQTLLDGVPGAIVQAMAQAMQSPGTAHSSSVAWEVM